MADNERVTQVVTRAESLVKQLDETVSELVELLRGYSDRKEENDA